MQTEAINPQETETLVKNTVFEANPENEALGVRQKPMPYHRVLALVKNNKGSASRLFGAGNKTIQNPPLHDTPPGNKPA